MRKYPIAWFYILAFSISWLGMISIVLVSRGIAPLYRPYFLILSIFYAIGPALAAVIVSRVTRGKAGVRDLDKGLLQWRAGFVWYTVATKGAIFLCHFLLRDQLPCQYLRRNWVAWFCITTFAETI